MSFADVQNKTTISGFSVADEATILAAMKTAYEGSATARAMFDDWISVPGNTIIINFVKGAFQAYTNAGELEIDLNRLPSLKYIDNHGTVVKHTTVTTIVHELVHALTVRRDDGIGAINDKGDPTDYQGATVSFSNIIYRELGFPEQNSYIGQDNSNEGTQYTNGAAIDRSVVIDAALEPGTDKYAVHWDSSPAGDSSVVSHKCLYIMVVAVCCASVCRARSILRKMSSPLAFQV
jgi:hypothetical protein